MLETSLRRLSGKAVVGPDGERIGRLADVYESTVEGGGTFATVTTGLFGTSSSFFPLAAAELVDDEVRVPYSRDFVRQAPRVDNDDELTPEEEDRLFSYYGLLDPARRAQATAPAPDATPTPAPQPAEDATMTLSEERLRVGVERVVTGRARLRKYVVAETVTQTVPVRHEELRVVREPIAPGELAADVAALSEEEHELLLYADRPVVRKDVVPFERVRLDTLAVVGEETVSGEVRKEHAEVLGDPAAGTPEQP